MSEFDVYDEAERRLKALRENPYPGRGLVIGRNTFGDYVMMSWLMGRSPDSRNRLYRKEGERIFTDLADPSRPAARPELTIYNAMLRVDDHFVVSNGAQTDTIIEALSEGKGLGSGLNGWEYEPDAPNFTPRISAVLSPRHHAYVGNIATLRHGEDGRCVSDFYPYQKIPYGLGYCVTTYEGDGNPLPSFGGAPYPVPLDGDADMIAATYWHALDAKNRVSLAVKVIEAELLVSGTLLYNQYNPAPVPA